MTFVLHTNGPVQVGSNVLGGITNIGSALGSQVRGEPTSGEVTARIMALMAQNPTADFTCEDIAAALTACGPMGVSLATSALSLFGSCILAGGTIDTAEDHVSLTADLGVLVPESLQCSHQGNASISFRAHPYSADGVATPWTLSTAATLPAITEADLYTLSTAEIAGVTITQHIQIGVNFGLGVRTEAASSVVLPQIAAIRSVLPTITLTSSSQGDLLSGGLVGKGGAFSIVLRNRANGGIFGAKTLTLSGICLGLQETPFRVSGQGAAQVGLVGHVEWDGTNNPITFAAGT
jgi:hypothetical protein